MALPIQPTNTQAGCNPVSSNCVIWQGPDIPCITLCRGDSISDVTYKVAIEICTLVDQLSLTTPGFDLSCFPPICPKPENIHDLIQFILDQLCALTTGTSTTTGTSKSLVPGEVPVTNCQESMSCLVPIASCFQYTDGFGNLVVEMSIADYAAAIGSRVCSIASSLTALTNTVTDINDRLIIIEACDPCNPVYPPITIPTSCLTAGTNIDISDFVENLETTFCALQNSTGTPSQIYSAISQECINLDTSPSLTNTSVNMGSLPGWVLAGSYNTMADAINNMWITICDMRNAVYNVVTTCCTPSCDDVDVTMTASYTSPSILVDLTGSIGSFTDCYAAGCYITITDAYGNAYTTQINVASNINGAPVPINITATSLNAYTDYTVSLNLCMDDTIAGLKCSQSLNYSIVNSALCPSVTYSADVTYIDYVFANPLSSPVTYMLECWNSAQTAIVTTVSSINPAVGPVLGQITGLVAATNYQIRMRVIIGSTITDCPFTSVTTKP
jgi:hypothetical protein